VSKLDIGLIGYGEVGKIFSNELKAKSVAWVGAWDVKFADVVMGGAQRLHAQAHGVIACESARHLCSKANLVISAVTASNSLAVAQEAARVIQRGALFLDLNSVSPAIKQQSSAIINEAGAHYVEAGVMTSVPPYGLGVPMLLGGKQAMNLADRLRPLGFNLTPVSPKIGVASATKMSRSIMIKGMEALVIEAYTTARKYGVEDAMLATMKETFPGIDWETQGAYFFSRVAQHGKRRAEEMRESAATVRDAGFEPVMTSAIAEKHDWVASQAREGVFNGIGKDAPWQDYADRLLKVKPKA
jgi:3-hydroxyisobutyrate dehydrogenase-like beta-hydroxyacid dehydrogenase